MSFGFQAQLRTDLFNLELVLQAQPNQKSIMLVFEASVLILSNTPLCKPNLLRSRLPGTAVVLSAMGDGFEKRGNPFRGSIGKSMSSSECQINLLSNACNLDRFLFL